MIKNPNRLEYVREQYRQAREDHDAAMKIGDYFSLPSKLAVYEAWAQEFNWLDAIDYHLRFPHTWHDWDEVYPRRFLVWIAWPEFEVNIPMDLPPHAVEKGGLRWEYDQRAMIHAEAVAVTLTRWFLRENRPLDEMWEAVVEANKLLPFYDPDEMRYLRAFYMDLPWFESILSYRTDEWNDLKKWRIFDWLDADAKTYPEIRHCRERAGDHWPLVTELAAWAMLHHQKQIEWDPFKVVESEETNDPKPER